MKKLKLVNILFLLFFSLTGAAQSSQPKELHFNHLFVKDGMPEGRVAALLQDKEGYLWIGTQRGLVRYDGYKPRVYTLGVKNPYDLYISKIYQDHKGKLWIGTLHEGLYEYDRQRDRFMHYPLDTSSSDSSSTTNYIYDIHKDGHGNLWIIRDKSLPEGKEEENICLFDPQTGKMIPYGRKERGKHHINATVFNSLFEDGNGSIWATSDNGIYEYNSREDRFMPHLAYQDSTQQRKFLLIHEDASHPGVFWLTSTSYDIFNGLIIGGSGLWRYNIDLDSATVFHHRSGDLHSIASDTILDLQNDAQGRLWVATMQGISLFDPVKQDFINYSPGDGKSKAVIKLEKDKNGNFWCATPQGLLFFNTGTGKFIRYTANANDPDGLASNFIANLYIGKRGIIWLGVSQIGLQWINSKRSRFIQYSNKQGSSHYFPGGGVNGFAESKDSTFWIAAEHGLYHWQPHIDSFTAIKFWQGQKKGPHAWPIMLDEKGDVWFGGGNGKNSGLYRYDPKTKKVIYFSYQKNDSTSLSNNVVSALYEDHLGNIWVGTFGGGICRFDRKTQSFIRYPFIINTGNILHPHGKLDDDEVITIYEDKKGRLWVGTSNGGLNSFDRNTGRFTSYLQIAPGFQCVLSIYEDHKNRLWSGTYMGGFFLFDRKKDSAQKYTEKNGLLYDGVWGILEDQKGNLWLPSSRGLSIFNPQTEQVRSLTTANGLPLEDLYNNAAFKTKNGQFLFATTDGFISLNPNDFTPDPHPPVVHIESVDFIDPQSRQAKDSTIVVFGKNNIRLHYNENRLTFHYVGLYYQNTALNQYACKLDGYDKDWVPVGTQRTVTYTNLSPGTYTFHVKAANSDGVWSVKNPSLTLIISPPWWKTWWAYLFYIIIVIAIVWAIIAYRSRQLKRSNEMLEKKVSQRTSQLNESLENLKSTQKQLIQSEKMASLGELTAGIAHEIQNPLNFVNNFSEVNTELIEELKAERLKPKAQRDEELESEILNDIKGNEEKITFHGKRADAIVKGMLQHSRGSSGHKELTDINALADEYLRLSYHGLRAKDKSFNATMKTDFDETLSADEVGIGKINIVPQDIGRVLLNLINNAFYAVSEKRKVKNQKQEAQPISGNGQPVTDNGYEPTVWVSTKKKDGYVTVKVKDNGNGIPQKALNKIFQPFFTTKPTGEGTGLGLSLSYEIIKVHNGEIKVNTKEGEGTEFIVRLPVA